MRGVNAPQIRVPALRARRDSSGEAPPQAAMLAWYTNRASYLLAIGRPAAQVALYHPANSMWLGDEEADRGTTKLGKQLLEHQIDFDYFDEQSLSSVAALENGGFRNLSGQVYRAVIVPVFHRDLARRRWNRLHAMAAAGGKVIFVGDAPPLVVDRTFLDAKEKPDLSFATLLEPAGDITARVIAALPKPDVALDSPCPRSSTPPHLARRRPVLLLQRERPTAIAHRLGRRPRTGASLGRGHRRDSSDDRRHRRRGLPAPDADARMVPDSYAIGMDQLMDTEQGHGMNHDPKNLDVKVKVGWVKGLNRLYFLYEAYDNYWDFAAARPAQRHLRSRRGRRSLRRAADRYLPPRRLDPRSRRPRSNSTPRQPPDAHFAMHGVHAQNYHIFTPPGDKDWAMAWGCAQYIKDLPYANAAYDYNFKPGESGQAHARVLDHALRLRRLRRAAARRRIACSRKTSSSACPGP